MTLPPPEGQLSTWHWQQIQFNEALTAW